MLIAATCTTIPIGQAKIDPGCVTDPVVNHLVADRHSLPRFVIPESTLSMTIGTADFVDGEIFREVEQVARDGRTISSGPLGMELTILERS